MPMSVSAKTDTTLLFIHRPPMMGQLYATGYFGVDDLVCD